jgi:hypothetical protein
MLVQDEKGTDVTCRSYVYEEQNYSLHCIDDCVACPALTTNSLNHLFSSPIQTFQFHGKTWLQLKRFKNNFEHTRTKLASATMRSQQI